MARRKKDEKQGIMTPESDAFAHLKNPRQRAFLSAYVIMGVVSKAAEAAGIHRKTHYEWLNNDPEYVEAFRQAEEDAIEALEREARRRALEGIEEPIYQGGKKVGVVRKYSDTLLIFLLKGAAPDKYRERVQTEHTGRIDSNMTVTHDLSKLSDQELRQLESILNKAQQE